MLFPLGQELQCEDNSQKDEISDPKQDHKNTETDSEEIESENAEKQEYVGPVTRAKAKALEQANALMAHYFGTYQCQNKKQIKS